MDRIHNGAPSLRSVSETFEDSKKITLLLLQVKKDQNRLCESRVAQPFDALSLWRGRSTAQPHIRLKLSRIEALSHTPALSGRALRLDGHNAIASQADPQALG